MKRLTKDIWIPALAAVITLLAMALGSLRTSHRGWGFGVWSFLGPTTPWLLFGAGLTLMVLIVLFAIRYAASASVNQSSHVPAGPNRFAFMLQVCGLMILAFVLFRAFRVQSYFLGDGYTLLANLGAANPILKGRQLVASWITYWLSGMLDGPPGDRALSAYQIVSWLSGLLFVAISGLFAARAYVQTHHRLLFVLGLLSGGYALMFFGYVENYSLFLVTVLAFTGCGALGAAERWPFWPIPLLIGVAVALHVFGVLLVPAGLYLLGVRLGWWRKLTRTNKLLRRIMGIVLCAGAIAAVVYFYQTSLFFRFSLVPLTTQFYTVSDYTLFSINHLADMGSLLVLLVPGLLVLIAAVAVRNDVKWQSAELRFLGILTLTCLGAAFLFDPKLGMPRDWDLFAFIAVPLLFLALRVVISDSTKSISIPAVLTILLGIMALGGRVMVQTGPLSGLALADSYYRLDPLRNKNLLLIMHRFHMDRGEIELAKAVSKRWTELPEEQLYVTAQNAWGQHRQAEAIAQYEQAIRYNPTFPPSYWYLSQCYFMQQRLDTAIAILETARGLSPHNPRIYAYLGYMYYEQGQRRKGEEFLNRALEYDPLSAGPYFYLSLMALDDGRADEHERLLRKAVLQTDASGEMFLLLAGIEATQKNYERAATAARMALERFIDTSEVRNLVKQHPPLKEWLPAYAE